MRITSMAARRLAVASQYLTKELPEKRPLLNVMRQLGCIQLDPINVVARSPLLVLWSRLGNYDEAHFDHVLWEEKALFEYWAHAASIVLTENLPIHQMQMRQVDDRTGKWSVRAREWMAENATFRDYILTELANRGPLMPTELEDRSIVSWKSGGWTTGRNVGLMLDLLWQRGQIMVARREGIRRYWQVTERHLPQLLNLEPWSTEKVVYEAAQIALRALGVGRERDIRNHFIRGDYPDLGAVLARLVAEGKVLEVEVAAFPETWYLHCDSLPLLERVQTAAWQPHTTLLSPFDNLICDRDRTELLFDFFYRSEIYTPKHKRQFGYYVMPILHGERLVGRIDPKLDRKKKVLNVNAVFLEEGVSASANLAGELAQAIERLALFLGANQIDFGSPLPAGWRQWLQG